MKLTAPSHIFFAGRYTYRRTSVLTGGLVALAFGFFVLVSLVMGILSRPAWSLKVLGTVSFMGGIGGLLAVAGLVLLKRWTDRTCLGLEISSAGILYGAVFHSWDAIRWVAGHSDRECVELFYQTRDRGLAGFDRHLPVDHNPTLQEYEELMESLRAAFQAKYPGVVFGKP
jgi:hypothetical protein